jgi:hypothetical protein
MPVAPLAPVPGASTATPVPPAPGGDNREVTIHKEVDEKGKSVTEKDIHKEGVAGSTETHTKTETDPMGPIAIRTAWLAITPASRTRS